MTDELLELPARINTDEIPRWVKEKYVGMEKDIEEWYTSYFFYRTWDGRVETLNTAKARARAKALAKYQSVIQTKALAVAAEGSAHIQTYDAIQKGWHKYVDEIEDAKELIEHILNVEKEKNPQSAAVYELTFIYETLVPALERLNVPKEMILCIPANMTKAKWGVKSLRQIINNNGEQMTDHLYQVMNAVADESITVDVFREEVVPKIMGEETKKTPMPVQASVCMLPDNREIIIIPSTPAHTKAIKMSTRSIVDGYGYTDPTYLIKEVMKVIKPKEFSRHKYKANEFGVLKQSGDGGVYLPAVETFRDLVLNEYAKHRYYIRRPGKHKLIIDELAFSYNLSDFVDSIGYTKEQDAFDAILTMYEPTLADLLADLPAEDFVSYSLGIDLVTYIPSRPAYHLFLELEFGNAIN